MRKRLLIVLAIISYGFVAAQQKGSLEMGFGLGYNMSSVASTEQSGDTKGGLNIAGSLDYYFSDRWSIKGKFIYDQKGWANELIETEAGFVTTDIELNYITVPVMANWHFGKKRNWYLNFGPYAGFLISAKDSEADIDLKDAFQSSDFGLAYGIGVKIPLNDKLRIYFEYDGQGGFSNIFKESDINVRNSRSSFNVGLNFMVK